LIVALLIKNKAMYEWCKPTFSANIIKIEEYNIVVFKMFDRKENLKPNV